MLVFVATGAKSGHEAVDGISAHDNPPEQQNWPPSFFVQSPQGLLSQTIRFKLLAEQILRHRQAVIRVRGGLELARLLAR